MQLGNFPMINQTKFRFTAGLFHAEDIDPKEAIRDKLRNLRFIKQLDQLAQLWLKLSKDRLYVVPLEFPREEGIEIAKKNAVKFELITQKVKQAGKNIKELFQLKIMHENLIKKRLEFLVALQIKGISFEVFLEHEKFKNKILTFEQNLQEANQNYENKLLEFEQNLKTAVITNQQIEKTLTPILELDSNRFENENQEEQDSIQEFEDSFQDPRSESDWIVNVLQQINQRFAPLKEFEMDQQNIDLKPNPINQKKSSPSPIQNNKKKKRHKLQKRQVRSLSATVPQLVNAPIATLKPSATSILTLKNRIELSKKFNQSSCSGDTILHNRQKKWGQGDYKRIRDSYDFDFTTNEYVQRYLHYKDSEIQYFIDVKNIPVEKIISVLSSYDFEADVFSNSLKEINEEAIEFAKSLDNSANENQPQLTLLDRYHVSYTYSSTSGKLHKGRAFFATQIINEQKKAGVIFTATNENNLLFHRMFEELANINLKSFIRKFEMAPPHKLYNEHEEVEEKEGPENQPFIFKENRHAEMLPDGTIKITIDQGRVRYFIQRLY